MQHLFFTSLSLALQFLLLIRNRLKVCLGWWWMYTNGAFFLSEWSQTCGGLMDTAVAALSAHQNKELMRGGHEAHRVY